MGGYSFVEWLGCWVLAKSPSDEFMSGRGVFGRVGDHQETTDFLIGERGLSSQWQ